MLRNQNGKVLPIVLAISLLAQLLGGYLLTQSVVNRKLVQYEEVHVFMKYSSEAGFQWALAQIVDNPEIEGQYDKSLRDILHNDGHSYDGQYTILFSHLNDNRVRITVNCTASSPSIDVELNHTIAAIVHSETLQIIRKEHYDF